MANATTPVIQINEGNVGIGTTAPGAKLHVNKGGTAGVQTIVATLSSTSQRPVLQFSETSSSGITAGMSIEYHGVGSGDSNYMAINSVTGAPKVVIKSGGIVLFNAYDGTNNTGTPTYLLGTDVFGNIVKTLGSGIPGGPYLPLAGGTLTGDLTVSGGDITLGGTGRIQGIDTVSASTDAANKAYVDAKSVGILTLASANGITVTGGTTANATVGVNHNY
jgi:hypothetical protein